MKDRISELGSLIVTINVRVDLGVDVSTGINAISVPDTLSNVAVLRSLVFSHGSYPKLNDCCPDANLAQTTAKQNAPARAAWVSLVVIRRSSF